MTPMRRSTDAKAAVDAALAVLEDSGLPIEDLMASVVKRPSVAQALGLPTGCKPGDI